MEASEQLEKDLIKLKNKKGVDKLYIICQGDSPYKIIKYFEEMSICNFCKFVNFPFSRPSSLFKFIKKEEGLKYLYQQQKITIQNKHMNI